MLNGIGPSHLPQLPATGFRRAAAAGSGVGAVQPQDEGARRLLQQLFNPTAAVNADQARPAGPVRVTDEFAPHLGRHVDILA